MTVVSPLIPFAPISWWTIASRAVHVTFDAHEHFQKMSWRNRYRISGSNNPVLLTVPLIGGRDQHIAMCDARIANQNRWQVQHWRTLVSVYRRTPFFEHYEPTLQPLFTRQYDHLAQFSTDAHNWVKNQLRLKYDQSIAEAFIATYPADVIDMRAGIPAMEHPPVYYQVFEDRIGFQPDLSILDLLFSEGPSAISKLK